MQRPALTAHVADEVVSVPDFVAASTEVATAVGSASASGADNTVGNGAVLPHKPVEPLDATTTTAAGAALEPLDTTIPTGVVCMYV